MSEREFDLPREKHPTIERSDQEHLKFLDLSRGYLATPMINITNYLQNSDQEKEKGSKDAKSKSKSTKKKPTKIHSSSNSSTVATIQEKL